MVGDSECDGSVFGVGYKDCCILAVSDERVGNFSRRLHRELLCLNREKVFKKNTEMAKAI